MLAMKQNTNDGLQLVCWEYIDEVKTALNIEGYTLELKLIHEDDDKVYTFGDEKFSKSGQIAAIDFTPTETAAFLAGKYKIQLAAIDDDGAKAIALTDNALKVIKTY